MEFAEYAAGCSEIENRPGKQITLIVWWMNGVLGSLRKADAKVI
jgi:hypothetical protein